MLLYLFINNYSLTWLGVLFLGGKPKVTSSLALIGVQTLLSFRCHPQMLLDHYTWGMQCLWLLRLETIGGALYKLISFWFRLIYLLAMMVLHFCYFGTSCFISVSRKNIYFLEVFLAIFMCISHVQIRWLINQGSSLIIRCFMCISHFSVEVWS